MLSRWIIQMSLILLLGLAPQAGARTWYVEKDGSGDHTTIYSAMNAASSGDTIMIGPGRYDDFHPLVAPAWTTEAIVPVTKDNLTFIGSGNTETIVGPLEMYLPGTVPRPKAIATVEDISAKFINLGIENAYDCLYWPFGRVEIDGCGFENYGHGVYLFGQGGGEVKDSVFYSDYVTPIGLKTYHPCGPVTISGCSFGGPDINEIGIAINGTQNVQIDNCNSYARSTIIFDNSSGTVINCTTTEAVGTAVWATNASQVNLIDNQLHGNYASIYVNGWSQVSGEGNIFTGGDVMGTIFISSQSQVTLNNNHILKSGDFAAKIGQYFYEIVTNDLTGNYWGTTDTNLIAEWIWDYSDDPVTRAYINFLPIAGGPLPTEKKTLGDLKAMYR